VSDPDLCASGQYTCGKNSICVNTVPGYTCNCLPGFQGDGAIGCEDIDECVSDLTHKCGENAICVNTDGSFICKCPEGFGGDSNIACIDIDECSLDHGCDVHAECINKPGSYACMCLTGYNGDGVTCEPEPCACELHGDPVVTSFDGSRFPLIGQYRYHLSGNINSDDATCLFRVFVTTMTTGRFGDFQIGTVQLKIAEDPIVGSTTEVDLSQDGISYKLSGQSDYTIQEVPGKIPETNLVTRFEEGTWYLASEQDGCLLNLSVNFGRENGDDAKLRLATSRNYKLDGVCGNCNTDEDEFIGENGENLRDLGRMLNYVNNNFGEPANINL